MASVDAEEQASMRALENKLKVEQDAFSSSALKAAKAEFEIAQGVEARDRAGIHYAAVLIASPSSDDIREGRMIAEDFVASAIVQQDAMLRAAIAAWRLQQPDVVRAWLSQLLRLNPQHVEGTALLHLYEAQVWRDGMKGFGIAAAVLAVAGLGLYFYFRGDKKQQGGARVVKSPYLGGGYYYAPKR